MKKTLLAALLGFTGFVAAAQTAYEGKVKYQKVEEPAILIQYNYPREVVESALKAKLSDLRLKTKTSKGFITTTGSVISDISRGTLDYSFKLDESGKKDKKITTLAMLMQGGNTISDDAVVMAANGKKFLENLTPMVKKSDNILQIKKQEEILTTEEKKLKSLQSDYKSLEKKMSSNKEDQNKQEKIIASQKSILEDLKNMKF